MVQTQKIVVLTGAGISAESGVKTFRGSGGLWRNHDITKVASPEGWQADPAMVLEFYNIRRRYLLEVEPNDAHKALVQLEENFDVTVITQNVDDLHERAGSREVIHLHGELLKSRSTGRPDLIYRQTKDIELGDTCEQGFQLRPHIVWFGESVPMMDTAISITTQADILLVIGSSMQVYPAAGLAGFAPLGIPVYYVDPNPSVNPELAHHHQLQVIPEKASIGVPELVNSLLQ